MNTLINEKPCLVQAKQGFSVSYKNKFLYSKYNPQSTIEKLISELQIQEDSLIIINSPILFYGIDLLKNKLPNNSVIIAIEHDKNLYDFSINCEESNFKNFQNTFPNFTYFNLNSQNEIINLFLNKNFTNKIRSCKRVVKINLSVIFNEYELFYQTVFNYFTNYISQFWKNRITLTKLGKLFSKNIFLNLPQIATSQKVKLNSINKPILVFGAGTSIDKTVNDLEKSKLSLKDFFIICVDSALKSLLEYKINPDIVVAVESQLANEKAFIGTKKSSYLLISDFTSRPNINKYKNQSDNFISFIFTEYCNANFLDKIKNLSLPVLNFIPLGSVGLYAIQLAIKLRKDNYPIFFTGLDFAYTTDATHCKNAPASFYKLLNSSRINSLIKVDSAFKFGTSYFLLNNQKIISDKPLQNYAVQFIENFGQIQNLYNLSETSIFDFIDNNQNIKQIHTKNIFELTKNYFSKQNNKIDFIENISKNTTDKIKNYISNEILELNEIKNYLMNGNIQIENLKEKINEHDYLFLHFPDGYNGAKTDLSFLKRVRNEIDFFLKILNRSLNQF